jgi:hypothetical protein
MYVLTYGFAHYLTTLTFSSTISSLMFVGSPFASTGFNWLEDYFGSGYNLMTRQSFDVNINQNYELMMPIACHPPFRTGSIGVYYTHKVYYSPEELFTGVTSCTGFAYKGITKVTPISSASDGLRAGDIYIGTPNAALADTFCFFDYKGAMVSDSYSNLTYVATTGYYDCPYNPQDFWYMQDSDEFQSMKRF